MDPFPPVLIAVVIAVFFLASGIRIAQQYQRAVVFRLGLLKGIRRPGIY